MKNKIEIEKYIEIPFENQGRSFEGCDCWGLVRLIYENEYGISLPSFTDVYSDASEGERVAEALVQNKPLINYVKKDSPEYGDVIVFNIRQSPCHVGIYVGKNMVIHVLRGTDSCCERLNSYRLKGRVEGYYEVTE